MDVEMDSLKGRLASVRKLCSQKTRKLQEFMAITQITNDVDGKTADYAVKI